jgi:FixJ family two-component response regulator
VRGEPRTILIHKNVTVYTTPSPSSVKERIAMPTSLGNILLADDEETFLEATSDLFQEEGYDCQTVRNADELRRLLNGPWDFDVLITDLNMPGNRVMELIDDIRSKAQQLPVIVVTGYPSLPTAVESVRLHVLEYFIKPINFTNLLSAVQKGIQHKQVLRAVQKAKKEADHRTQRLASIEEALQSQSTFISDPAVEDALLGAPQWNELKLQFDGVTRFLKRSQGQGSAPMPSSTDYFRLRESLYDTIQVLHKTKNAFRSKDLALLRKRLEEVLRTTADTHAPPPSPNDQTLPVN